MPELPSLRAGVPEHTHQAPGCQSWQAGIGAAKSHAEWGGGGGREWPQEPVSTVSLPDPRLLRVREAGCPHSRAGGYIPGHTRTPLPAALELYRHQPQGGVGSPTLERLWAGLSAGILRFSKLLTTHVLRFRRCRLVCANGCRPRCHLWEVMHEIRALPCERGRRVTCSPRPAVWPQAPLGSQCF